MKRSLAFPVCKTDVIVAKNGKQFFDFETIRWLFSRRLSLRDKMKVLKATNAAALHSIKRNKRPQSVRNEFKRH